MPRVYYVLDEDLKPDPCGYETWVEFKKSDDFYQIYLKFPSQISPKWKINISFSGFCKKELFIMIFENRQTREKVYSDYYESIDEIEELMKTGMIVPVV